MIVSLATADIKHLRRILAVIGKLSHYPAIQFHETGVYIYSQEPDKYGTVGTFIYLRLDPSYFYEYELTRPCTVWFTIKPLINFLWLFDDSVPFVHIYMEDPDHLIVSGGNKQIKLKVYDEQCLLSDFSMLDTPGPFDLELPLAGGRYEDIRGLTRNSDIYNDKLEIHYIGDQIIEFRYVEHSGEVEQSVTINPTGGLRMASPEGGRMVQPEGLRMGAKMGHYEYQVGHLAQLLDSIELLALANLMSEVTFRANSEAMSLRYAASKFRLDIHSRY